LADKVEANPLGMLRTGRGHTRGLDRFGVCETIGLILFKLLCYDGGKGDYVCVRDKLIAYG